MKTVNKLSTHNITVFEAVAKMEHLVQIFCRYVHTENVYYRVYLYIGTSINIHEYHPALILKVLTMAFKTTLFLFNYAFLLITCLLKILYTTTTSWLDFNKRNRSER